MKSLKKTAYNDILSTGFQSVAQECYLRINQPDLAAEVFAHHGHASDWNRLKRDDIGRFDHVSVQLCKVLVKMADVLDTKSKFEQAEKIDNLIRYIYSVTRKSEFGKKVEAGYFDKLKELVEGGYKNKYATIEEALEDFCKRTGIDKGQALRVKAQLQKKSSFDKERIDELMMKGTPAEAIINEVGTSDEEKQMIAQYIKGNEEKRREECSQIVRDMRYTTDDTIKPPIAVPKMSGIRNLSKVV